MHLDDERIQRWLHHELSRSEQEATDRHVAECATCRSKLDEARAEERWTFDRLGRLDAPVPAVDVSAIARRAHARTVAAWMRRAAGVVIVAAAAGVAYTAPGSPVRAWVTRLTGGSERPAESGRAVAPERGSTPRSSGIALVPGARFTIRFAAPQSSGVAMVRVTDDDRVVVRAVNGSATFTTDADGLAIGNAESTADYEIELPRGAPWIEIDLGPRGLLRKEGRQLVTDAPTDSTGRHVLSLVAKSAPYRPHIDPANFQATVDNPYLPLVPGTSYLLIEKQGKRTSENEVTVTHETRKVMGVTCVVVHDVVRENGVVTEETYDWYAQDRSGNVWYFGEDTKEYHGDQVSTEGSWEAGIGNGQPGIIMPAHPVPAAPYRQEYNPGNAEDMGQIVAVNDSVTVPYGSFRGCVRTKEWSLLEPGTEQKWYAKGIGVVRTESTSKEVVVLVSVTRP